MKNLLLTSLILLLGCRTDINKYDENLLLKAKLQGTWISSPNKGKYDYYRALEVTFSNNLILWKDSTVSSYDSINKSGRIEVRQGNNPVAYGYNNGDTPIRYGSALTYFFLDRPENNIVWIDIGTWSYKEYELENDIATLTKHHPPDTPHAGHTLRSSSVVFRNNDTEAEFWGPSFDSDPDCYIFQKVDL